MGDDFHFFITTYNQDASFKKNGNPTMKQYTGVRFLLFANLPCSGRTEKINSVCGLGDSQLVHNHICVDSYWEFLTRSAEKKPELINYHIIFLGNAFCRGFACLFLLTQSNFFIENGLSKENSHDRSLNCKRRNSFRQPFHQYSAAFPSPIQTWRS